MSKLFDRLVVIIFFSDLHDARFILALAEIIWSITLLWEGETFARPTYTQMSHVMSEEAWGFVFILSAIAQLGILFKGDYHSRFATYFAGWNSALWLFVTISMYMSVSPPPAAISGEAALTFAAAWIWVRSGYVSCEHRSTSCHTKVQ